MKEKKRINWFDQLLIFALIALIVGSVLKFTVLNPGASNGNSEVNVTMKLHSVRKDVSALVQTGDTVYIASSKSELGTITKVESSPSEGTFSADDGTVFCAPYENRVDLTITVSCKADCVNDPPTIGTYPLFLNRTDTYYTKYFGFNGTTLTVTPVPGDAA